jgi:hypothetical protein
MAALTGTRSILPKGPQSEAMTLAKPLALVEGSAVKKSSHSGASDEACGQTPRSTSTCFKKASSATDLSQNFVSVPPITCNPHPSKISGEVPSLEINKTHSLPVDKGATSSSAGKKSTDAQRKKSRIPKMARLVVWETTSTTKAPSTKMRKELKAVMNKPAVKLPVEQLAAADKRKAEVCMFKFW